MKSRWIINLLLLLAVGILSLVAVIEPGIEQPAQAQVVTTLTLDQVKRVHINRPVRDDLVLLKSDSGNWVLERTPALPADNFKVNALIRLVEQKVVRSYPVSELELSRLQLDPPYATAIFNDTAIEFGSLEPLEGLRYLRVADQVLLVPDLYQHLIEAGYSQFVRRRLFEEGSRINRITLPDFSISREDPGWSVDPQQQVPADSLQQFIQRWQDAAALNVQAADSVDEGEAVKLVLAGRERGIKFLITAREPELVLVRPDLAIQYRMGSSGASLLTLAVPEAADEAQSAGTP